MPRFINVDTRTVISPSLLHPSSDSTFLLDAEIKKGSPEILISLANFIALRQRIRVEEMALREATDRM